jgi:hypothetical protein
MISTYRFWGLVFFDVFTIFGIAAISSFLGIFMMQEIGTGAQELGVIFAIRAASGLLSFFPAWFITRWKTLPMLIVFGVLQLLGVVLLSFSSLASIAALRYLGAFLWGLASGTVSLVILAIFAGSRGRMETFAIAFGINTFLTNIVQIYAPIVNAQLWDIYGSLPIGITTTVLMVLGLIFLLPVNPSLFNGPPSQRGYPLPPTTRDSLFAGLKCLIPFYWLYWLYRVHGEITAFYPTRSILSPRASVFACIFVPFILYPVIMTSLSDALNQYANSRGRSDYMPSWVIFLFAVFFYPVAVGLLQASLNHAQAEQGLATEG